MKRNRTRQDDGLRRRCGGKVCYTKVEAATQRNAKKREGRRLRIYACNECSCWHLTHLV